LGNKEVIVNGNESTRLFEYTLYSK